MTCRQCRDVNILYAEGGQKYRMAWSDMSCRIGGFGTVVKASSGKVQSVKWFLMWAVAQLTRCLECLSVCSHGKNRTGESVFFVHKHLELIIRSCIGSHETVS